MENWVTRNTLIARAKDPDDNDAWDEFCHYYHNFIIMVLRKLNTPDDYQNDICQEILIRLWRDLPGFDFNPKKAKFRTWLSTVIRNTMLNQMDKLRRHNKRIYEFQSNFIEQNNDNALNELIETEWKAHLGQLALKKINGVFTGQALEVFTLSLNGKSTAEICQELNMAQNTVYKLKGRVRDRMIHEIAQLRNELEF